MIPKPQNPKYNCINIKVKYKRNRSSGKTISRSLTPSSNDLLNQPASGCRTSRDSVHIVVHVETPDSPTPRHSTGPLEHQPPRLPPSTHRCREECFRASKASDHMLNSISNLFPLLLFLYPSNLLGCTLFNSLAHLGGPTGQLELELTVESKFGFRLALIIEKARRFANQSCSWI
mgnify:FL=1